jgi:ArsR family transcriptional regulator, arsenate/arsenite/antimonite-responsive transcriptional repressor
MLSGLAQETRLRIFRELVRHHGPCTADSGLAAGALATTLAIAPPTLSFHLKEMSRAGLVKSRKHGRSIIYRADLEGMGDLVNYLLEDCCGGQCQPLTGACP